MLSPYASTMLALAAVFVLCLIGLGLALWIWWEEKFWIEE